MANFLFSVVLLAVVAFTTIESKELIAPRIIGGVPADTLRRFPHHVKIESKDGRRYLCGGSILNEQWVLTSRSCVEDSARLELQFERLYINNATGSYSAVVNSDAVHIYPTYYDDIALVKLPVRLVFSDLIKPVTISSQTVSQLQNKLVVLPGYNTDAYNAGLSGTSSSAQLNYAMLTVIPSANCKNYDGFDEYQQLCTKGYSNNRNQEGHTDHGNGLLVGWPARSELVGIFTIFGTHNSGDLGIYTNVAKYASWINSVISYS